MEDKKRKEGEERHNEIYEMKRKKTFLHKAEHNWPWKVGGLLRERKVLSGRKKQFRKGIEREQNLLCGSMGSHQQQQNEVSGK